VVREELREVFWTAQRLEPVRDATMLLPALRAWNLLVGDLADERVAERILRLASDRAPPLPLDELAPFEQMECRLRRLALVAEPSHPEHAPENRRVLEQLLLFAVEDVEAGGDEPLDRLR
jgi:hypothetical protein